MTDITISVLEWHNTLIIVSAVQQSDVSHGTGDAGGKFIVSNKAKNKKKLFKKIKK